MHGRPGRRLPPTALVVAVAAVVVALAVAAATISASVQRPAARRASAGAGASGTPAALPRADPSHPPMAWGGPDGRSALDGTWIVREDPDGIGRLRGWARGGFSGRTVHVPYSPNAAIVRGAAGMRSYEGSVAWYRTSFAVARAGDYALRFESVNHRASVWVDGHLAAHHTGEYLPFDVALHLAPGPHTLVVRADWRSPAHMSAEGWHRAWFNFGGINREVTVRPLGRSELAGPGVVTRLRGRTAIVRVSVVVRNRAGPRTIRVAGAVGATRLAFRPARLGRGEEREVRAVARIAHPDLWSPRHPALTVLRLAVPGEAGWTQRVGLREITWRGGRLRVNGRHVRLQGASLQEDVHGAGDALRADDMDALVSRLRDLHANATRAQHALSPALLERLDAAGILVWQGVGPSDAPGNWTSRTPALRRLATARVLTSVRDDQAHPSVLAWNLANEVAHDGHTGGQAAWVDATARRLHRLDPGRPVAVDIWGSALPTDDDGALYRHVDVVGATMYEGWYQRPGEPPSAIGGNLARRLAALRAIFPGRVLVVTEFGAEANRLNPSDAPGGYAFQAQVLRENIRAFQAERWLDGWLVWSLQDFALTPTFGGGSIRTYLPALRLVPGVNQKGLYTYGGRPKPSVGTVRLLFARG
jgi:Glycosyl hydrolases family 2, TIM barrel domain/Glycosyl hydrolases family 2, sugar binding domain